MKFTIKEVIWIIISILIFWVVIGISYNQTEQTLKFGINPLLLLIAAIVVIINILAKKIAAPRYSAKITNKLWTFERWGFYKRSKLPKPIPMGIIFPLLISILTLGFIKPMIFLQYDAENNYPKRLLKKQGTRRAERKLELNEVDMAFISVWGFYSLLLLAIIGAILTTKFNIQLGYQLAKYSIFYGAWNLVPFGQLDGAKTFYGSPFAFTILAVFYLIALLLVFIF